LVRIFAVLVILGGVGFIAVRLLLPIDGPVAAGPDAPTTDEPGSIDAAASAKSAAAGTPSTAPASDVTADDPSITPAEPSAAPTEAPVDRGTRGLPPAQPAPRDRDAEDRSVEVAPARTPTPAPSSLPAGSVDLEITHRAIAAGDAGASDLVSVRLSGPPDSRVVLFSGPPGGPYGQSALRGKSGGRWEGWITFAGSSGGRFEYWIVASHPAADRDVTSGSRSSPHVVELR